MKLFEYNPTSRVLNQTCDAQRLEGGSDAMFLHLLKTHEGRQKMLLVRHIPKSPENPKEVNFGALVYGALTELSLLMKEIFELMTDYSKSTDRHPSY